MKVYPTKIDIWLIIVFVGTILFCIGLGIYIFQQSKAAGSISIASGVFTVFLISLFLPCKYTMLDDHLLVQAGVLKEKIKYKDIVSVKKSSNPLSAPAFSLKRVKINHSRGFTLVSPKDRDGFISELNTRIRSLLHQHSEQKEFGEKECLTG